MEEMKTALLELSKQICEYDGFRLKYALIFQSTVDETADIIGVITTRALYKNGRNSLDREEDAFSAYKTNGKVNGLIYKYIDGEWVQQTGKVFPYATYSSSNKCNTFYNGVNYLANYKITWSNYPVFRVGVLRGVETTEETAVYGQRLKPVAYKESDEPLTLDMLPAGAGVVLGRYKAGTSEIAPLTWIVCDYTERFTKAITEGDITNIYGENNVVLTSEKVIDVLPVNDTTDFKNSLAWDRNSELMKYLNSDASNNYWYEAFDGDTQDNRGYFPEGGFLRYFTQQEKEILQTVYTRRSASSLIEGKVHLPSLYEIASTSKANYVTNWLVCEFSLYYITDPLLHPILEHHPVSPQTNFTKYVRQYWKKEISGSQGAQLSGTLSTSTTAGNLENYVLPCIYLPADQPVKVTPNANGDYEIEFPFIETFEVDYILTAERQVTNSIDTVLNTKRNPACAYEITMQTNRLRTASSNETLSANRKVYFNGPFGLRYKLRRKRIRDCSKVLKTKRDIIAPMESILPLHRDVAISLFWVDSALDTKRNQIVDYRILYRLRRQVIIEKAIDFTIKTKRKTRVNDEMLLDTARNITLFEDFALDISTRRLVVDVTITGLSGERKVIDENNVKVNTVREVAAPKKIDSILSAKRCVIDEVDTMLLSQRHVVVDTEEILNTIREVSYMVDIQLQSIRKVIGAVDTEASLSRNVVIETEEVLNTARLVANFVDYTIQAKRQVIDKSQCVIDTVREITYIVDTDSLVNTRREVIADTISDLPLHREVLSVADIDILFPAERSVVIDYSIDTSTLRHVVLFEDALLNTARVVKAKDKEEAIELLQAVTVKNNKGQSNIKYEQIDIIKGKYYPVKANVESTPIGLSDKTKFLLITKNRKIKSEHFVRVNGRIYGIDMLTKYSVHKEVYLKEL